MIFRACCVLMICLGFIQEAHAADKESLVVLVAASAQDAMREIAAQFTQETGIEVRLSAGGSNTLATQIIHGAAADLFLSASPEWAQAVKERGLCAEDRPLVGNDLVLIVPTENPAKVFVPADLKQPAVKYVALAGENVPAGRYAEQALKAATVYEDLAAAGKIVRGQDVRVTLNYVERAEADAGVVYSTDAMQSSKVKVVHRFDLKTHAPIVYPLLLLKKAGQNPAAKRFYAYLGSPAAGDIFVRHGFSPLP